MSEFEIKVDPVTGTSPPRVEDLVKKALKEALEKRKLGKATPLSTGILEELVEAIGVPAISPIPFITKVVLLDSQKFLSDVIGTKLGSVVDDFPVTIYHKYDWDERILPFIPVVDDSYILDKDLSANILRAWELNEKILCYGPTGAGKSSLIEQLCARTSRPFIRINCTGDMDSSMIFGQLTAKEGSTIWVDGCATEAVKYGAVFAWDEWDVTPPEISMGLQWLLEDNGKLMLKEMPGTTKDKQIIPHEHFRLVAIGNTQGQGDDTGAHSGTNVQNSATLDRFGTAIYVDYLQPTVEVKMILNKWKHVISTKAAQELVKLANLIRTGYKAGQFSLTVSPRSLLNICKKLSFNCSLKTAFELVYLNKLSDTQRKVASELFRKVYGTNET